MAQNVNATLDAQHRVDESAELVDRARELIARQPPGTNVGPLEAAIRG
ncbi:MAG: hypothetical protein ACXVP8_01045 [Actinomycetota bacterium]